MIVIIGIMLVIILNEITLLRVNIKIDELERKLGEDLGVNSSRRK